MTDSMTSERVVAEAPEISAERRGRTKLRQLSHTAVRVRDMHATRHFYEDVLGLSLVATMVITDDPRDKIETNYMHCFFELADGSALAFFQFDTKYMPVPDVRDTNGFDRHLALRVDDEPTLRAIEKRYGEEGLDSFVVDHGEFLSLYTRDPDGDNIEITVHQPSHPGIINPPLARDAMETWLAGLA